MAKTEGVEALLAKLRGMMDKYQPVDVTVSFSAPYALFVHEDLTARHPIGQAKFLEQPARTMRADLAQGAAALMKKGVSMPKALYTQGLRLQRAAQLLCPVETGFLRNSAMTEIEYT